MTQDRGGRKDKNQNIQVFVRLRPLNQRERDIKSLGVVDVVNNREVVVRQSSQTQHTKRFTFDRAFPPTSKQVEVYQDVVSPLIEEVLAGYNCTVFAYGQTGTGKTHTMVGENTGEGTTWQNDPLAGIIPRALSQLFDELRLSNSEYTVRVSYLELYNEELFDLLSTSEDNSKLRIYEDVTRKGSNIVNGLEEITVYNKNEVYKIMAQGQERKRVASTLMNAQSSRSHTVFTIVVHMRDNSDTDEELVRIGKLNLVDLAGSENISKAGSDNPAKRERARECVNINQSLLTLGRVITALVERHPHIPYRESKLTRILQESLGGRTKTSIIATISPGHKDLEETMSTLEYANRAKNIQNKPEVNQRLTRKVMLKEYAEEIDRLKRDLQAARDKTGVYLANETFAEMTFKQEQQRKEIQELLLQKRAIEEQKEKMEEVYNELDAKLKMREEQLLETVRTLDDTKETLASTANLLNTTKVQYEEQQHLVTKHKETESKLTEQAKCLLNVVQQAAGHAHSLHDSVDKRRNLEINNVQVTTTYRQQAGQLRNNHRQSICDFVDTLRTDFDVLLNVTDKHSTNTISTHDEMKQKIELLVQRLQSAVTEVQSLTENSQKLLQTSTMEQKDELNTNINEQSSKLEQMLHNVMAMMKQSVDSTEVSKCEAVKCVDGFVDVWCKNNSERVKSLCDILTKFTKRYTTSEKEMSNQVKRASETKLQRIELRNRRMVEWIEEIKKEREQIETKLNEYLGQIENERKETEERLNKRREEFERQLEREQREMEERLSRRKEEIERERREWEDRMERRTKWQLESFEFSSEDIEIENSSVTKYQSDVEKCAKHLTDFTKLFQLDTSALSIDIESLQQSIGDIVDKFTKEMVRALQTAQHCVQTGVDEAIKIDKENSTNFKENTEVVFDGLLSRNKQVLDTVVENVQQSTSSTIEALSSVSNHTSNLTSSMTDFVSKHSESVSNSKDHLQIRSEKLLDEVVQVEELEERMAQEFRVYSPSGNTPLRTEYRFPRSLVQSSPHERLLARFRAARTNCNDDDCVLVESSENSERISDNESVVSEDSAVFAEPTPIMKCTSETDVYAMRKQAQNKENERMTSSTKKASKLPAPQSLKRPLVDRNRTQ